VVTGESGEDTVPEQFTIGTHNTILFILFHQGIIGLVFYLVFMTAGFIQLVRVLLRKNDPATSILAFSLITAFLCVYLLHSTVETLPLSFPCIVFGILSGMQQNMDRERAASCP